ncbi:putative membrane protein [Methanobacterium sp. MB1]|jgi:Flp pilus assembly pilin Flp|nr:putative membrane protein [Methanobacterium sp. MB1]
MGKMVLNLFLQDEIGQGAAEYILLFGGVIVIAIATLLIYKGYIEDVNPLNASADLNKVRDGLK